MTAQEWADAGQTFAESVGFDDHPWVMVRHDEDHVHIVVSRINDEGTIWHARQEPRQAQTACAELERTYGLAQQLTRDPYVLDFLDLTGPVAERDLEHALMTRLQDFLLELGHGFAFIGRQ